MSQGRPRTAGDALAGGDAEGAAAEVLMAVDVGTSGARAVAIGVDGAQVLEVRRGYPTRTPRPGWAEQSPADWQAASMSAIAEAVRRLGRRRPVRAIALTGQCPSVVLVDRRGRPTGPGLTYRDNRATAEAEAIVTRFGEDAIHRRTGHRPAAFHVAPKLLWLRRHDRAAWDPAVLALQPRDWVGLMLTGEAATDGTHAAATLLYDLRGRRWDDEIIGGLELPPSLLPRLAGPSDVVGTLRPSVAERLGLPAATRVVLGGADSQACALGTGVVEPGPVSEMAGSSTCLNAAVGTPVDVLEVTHYPHVVGDGFTTETGINTTGAALSWVADRLYGGRREHATADDFATLDREAADVEPGARGLRFLPVLGGGERTDPQLRGAITGLSLEHGRAAIARAAMEGVAYAIRAQLELLTGAGVPFDELRVSGGDARLATWNQVKADVTGRPVRTFPGDAAATGVAMLAGLGAGVYRDVDEALDRCVRAEAGRAYLPDGERTSRYVEGYDAYRALVASTVVRRREA